ncbi:DNA damage-repair/toleration protein DRT100-like [Miscanthus floridulus]|uniref:DNA damage-repair/toleration protein DRT100-like n=1 Tax=Miscanthus floridulus TaxID=154761 RepID=UPI003457F3DC
MNCPLGRPRPVIDHSLASSPRSPPLHSLAGCCSLQSSRPCISPSSQGKCGHMALLPLPPLLFLLLLLFLGMLASRAPAQPATLHERDAAALRDLRASLRDLSGSRFFDTWDDARSPCAYAGVVCAPDDADGDDSPDSDYSSTTVLRVSVLTLGTGLADSPGLTGTLPDSLSTLAALTDLVLYPGRVSGPIPSGLGAGLRRLRLLSLAGNQLTGPVPASLAGLPDLHTLDLGGNRLDGAVPAGLLLPDSPSLKVLILANNGGISGEIPAGFASSGLFHVDLARNALAGGLPPLPATLRYFSVAGNAMQGTLDGAFGGGDDGSASPPPPLPADLAFLDLSMNNFSGRIPASVFALPGLSSLLLSRNNFTGALSVPPPSPQQEWAVVDVSHNGISGEVPEALAAAGSLYVNNNRLSGEVPAAVARSVLAGRMTTLYAQHNFLTGFPVPPAAPLPDSAALCLSYNCMDLPSASAADGCPTIGGPLEARPAEQCRSTTSNGGGGDG